ncbi:MAG TPA: bifunctional phosphoglucose/phosphomannose isomerase [Ignavibacteria bacterium]|nr:bifunctional phosphoglucose/phosphomannose isomerase [Ignavibacteria bacterium]
MIDRKKLKKYDRQGMFSVLFDFPVQVCDAVDIAGNAKLKNKYKGIRNIIINGLGGSAIGGDILRSYTAGEMEIPVAVNRNYSLPAYAGKNTLAILSSYSGNTEETVSAFNDALKKGCSIICVTSGGTIEKLAAKHKKDVIKIPGGLQPRCALGYSFFSLLILFTKLGFIKDKSDEINDVIINLEQGLSEYVNPSFEFNEALRIAAALKGRLPVVYSSADVLDAVNLRWRGQISENAKILAYGNLYPEMNHNELVGWELNEDILKNTAVIFLKDSSDNERIKLRMKITEKVFRKRAGIVFDLSSDCRTRLGRIFDLIYLGDWVSYYLSVFNEVDPTPVNAISKLKKELDRHI